MENNERDRRQPHNLQGLFKFALEATKSEDAPNFSNFQPMDPERKRFLEDAIKSITVDIVEQLEKAAKILSNHDSSEEELLNALDIIIDYVDNIDSANDFCKIGGLSIVKPCLHSSHATVRAKSADLVAELAQNNPFAQDQLLKINIFSSLIELLNNEQTSCSGMHAISSMIRSYEPGLTEFLSMGGLECIIGCLLKIGQHKLQIRSLFLINTLSCDNTKIQDDFINFDTIEIIVKLLMGQEIHGEYDTLLEVILSTLHVFVENCDAAKNRCCRLSELPSKLQQIIKLSEGKSDCLEILNYCKTLLQNIM